jgi:hypothetical protein
VTPADIRDGPHDVTDLPHRETGKDWQAYKPRLERRRGRQIGPLPAEGLLVVRMEVKGAPADRAADAALLQLLHQAVPVYREPLESQSNREEVPCAKAVRRIGWRLEVLYLGPGLTNVVCRKLELIQSPGIHPVGRALRTRRDIGLPAEDPSSIPSADPVPPPGSPLKKCVPHPNGARPEPKPKRRSSCSTCLLAVNPPPVGTIHEKPGRIVAKGIFP